MGRSPGFPIPNGFQLCIFRLYIHFPFVEFKHKSICRYCIYVFSVEKITDFFLRSPDFVAVPYSQIRSD